MKDIDLNEPGLHDAESVENLLRKTIEIVKSAKIMVLGCIDSEGHLRFATIGLDYNDIPATLRNFASHIERDRQLAEDNSRMEYIREQVAKMPNDRKGTCPQCGELVILLREIPKEAMRKDGTKHACCVCSCGAFLVPSSDESGALALRYMSDEEIIALPDQIRIQMMRARKHFLELRSNREQRQ